MARQGASRGGETVVFDIVRESQCSECRDELGRGSLIILEDRQPVLSLAHTQCGRFGGL